MILHPSLASFLEHGVSIHMGTRDDALQPNGTRVVAVVVEPDHAHLVAYIPAVDSALVVADLKANGRAALAFARPIDDRACQIKGECVEVRDAVPSELARVQQQWESLLAQLQLVGIPAEATQGWATWPCVAVRLRVTAAFEQTPGPGAGNRLESPEAG